MNKQTFDNIYRHGLQIGDIVSYSCRSLFQSYFGKHNSLVINKEFLLNKNFSCSIPILKFLGSLIPDLK